jgi:hypothetical protein
VTLIEMLVSVTLTLMVVFAIVQVFDLLGDNVTNSRAILDLSAQLRSVASRLQADLDGLTVTVLPPVDPGAAPGYLEILEGEASDRDANNDKAIDAEQMRSAGAINADGTINAELLPANLDPSLGDIDDVLALTTRSQAEPFLGRVDPQLAGVPGLPPSVREALLGGLLESQVAEVVWWVQAERNVADNLATISALSLTDQIAQAVAPGAVTQYPNGTPIRSLHRRALLIRPDLDDVLRRAQRRGVIAVTDEGLAAFFNNNDISARVERTADGQLQLRANSLADLTERQNRFAHMFAPPPDLTRPAGFPYPLSFQRRTYPLANQSVNLMADTNLLLRRGSLKNLYVNDRDYLRRGEDIVLTDLLSFDVRVFDPQAPLTAVGGLAVSPGDPAWNTSGPVAGRGAFVDLGYAGSDEPLSLFSGLPHLKSLLPGASRRLRYYCTWSATYERDGLDQDGVLGPDQQTNGVDDNGVGGVDDITERETAAPYPVPLRGITIGLRTMEFNTRQVRQVSVAKDFLPE